MSDRFHSMRRPPKAFTGQIDYIDHKDVETVSKALSPQGKLLSRKRTGADAKTQHKIRRAVHRARFMALIPYGG